MLRELHISNLAIIADVRIEFAPGLNCFTGSTGAGKSLVIGALQVLLGLRSPVEMLRPGVDEGRVSGIFEIKNTQSLEQIERIADTPLDGDGEILLSRRLYSSGRSSVSLNGHPITLAMLKNVAEHLVDVHGQHEHQFLLKPANQLDVLDQFAVAWPLRQKYQQVYQRLAEAEARLDHLSASRALRQQQLELYRFQAQEIDAVELDADEYEQLASRSSVLKNLQKLKKETNGVQAALYEADGSVLERLKMMAAILLELATLDVNLQGIAKNLRDATLTLDETAFDLSRYLGKLEMDPVELTEVDERLNAINRILHKYANTVPGTLKLRADLAEQIAELEKAGVDLSSLQKDLEPLRQDVRKLGGQLSQKRKIAAKKLGPLVQAQLAELGMDKARFSVQLQSNDIDDAEPAPSGFDSVEFIAQTNPGQLEQPLRKIASGGELSRIMLALKGILAASDRISVLVFDEIDANVGGRLGSIIGEKLRALASHHQVLCITHLPQIAAYADRHLTVRKRVVDKQTKTSVRVIDGAERIEELAEMIGGQHVTETTRAQALELLQLGTSKTSPAQKNKS